MFSFKFISLLWAAGLHIFLGTQFVGFALAETDPSIIPGLLSSLCTNCHKIEKRLGFEPGVPTPNVFDKPLSGYPTTIDLDQHCYVKIHKKQSEEQGVLVYSLSKKGTKIHSSERILSDNHELPDEQPIMKGTNARRVLDKSDNEIFKRKHITHTGPCGVCSSLKNLGVFLKVPHLEQLATPCSLAGVLQISQLLGFDLQQNPQDVFTLNELITNGETPTQLLGGAFNAGFQVTKACLINQMPEPLEDRCMDMWVYNGIMAGIKCLLPCISLYRNCDPMKPPPNGCPPANQPNNPDPGINVCNPAICPNTFNNNPNTPVCYPEMYEDGSSFRLNNCFQCDECHNWAIYRRYAGRTRRNSGEPSAIERPDSELPDIVHDYGLLSYFDF